ncbi:DUF6612 family protein [Bacillus suaedae]|uniref:Lipoprotein n=1 Tax=Halalkalibacter suaedae TaxID=2822140 RepID=A0A940WUI7_9BACI|nr:DUF6612 family protein [Bacillus suaedae]MBP3952546.1 hypothetical protein [Bacillus suaedae]
MKKSLSILLGVFFVLMLAACNSSADTVNNEDGTSSAKKSDLTLEQVFEKTTEASKELNSFKVNMDLNQVINSDQDEAANVTLESTLEMDVVQDPMAFHQKISTEIPGTEQVMEVESYFSKDGMYYYEPTSQTWMKFPSEMMEQLVQISNQQTNPAAEIENLRRFVDDFTFQQDDKSYILVLNASGEKFTDFLKETVEQTLPEGMANSAEAIESMKINHMDYEIHIDKETYYPTVLNLNMEMEMSAEGQKVTIAQDMKGQYVDHNHLEEIEIPQEVIEGAVEAQQ